MGHNVVIVTSGAVGVGCQRLGLSKRPDGLAAKQALAAVGQIHLMRYYTDLFSALGVTSAQAGPVSWKIEIDPFVCTRSVLLFLAIRRSPILPPLAAAVRSCSRQTTC